MPSDVNLFIQYSSIILYSKLFRIDKFSTPNNFFVKIREMKKFVIVFLCAICMYISGNAQENCADFNEVLELFSMNCMEGCHVTGIGGTYLTFEEMTAGSSANCGVPYIIVGDAENSYLYDKVNNDGAQACGGAMPIGQPLSEEGIDLIRRWINEGAIGNEISGCMDPTASNYNPEANCDNETCDYLGGDCCPDVTACNYDPNCNNTATTTCDYGIPACLNDPCNAVLGCTDPDSNNYNPEANCDDGSYCFENEVMGCTNECASNYDPDANADDGSCILPFCDDGCVLTTDFFDSVTCNCDATPPNIDDACDLTIDSFDTETCTIVNQIPTCDDGNMCTEDSFDLTSCTCLNIVDPTCDCETLGMNVEIYCGPDPDANEYYVEVKITGELTNYAVTSQTGTFTFRLINDYFIDGPYKMGEEFLYEVYGFNSPDCVTNIFGNPDNCVPGFFASLDDYAALATGLYPVPAKEVLYLEFNTEVEIHNSEIKIFDFTGKEVLSLYNTDYQSTLPIDVSNLTTGGYLLSIISNEKVQTLKFVKE